MRDDDTTIDFLLKTTMRFAEASNDGSFTGTENALADFLDAIHDFIVGNHTDMELILFAIDFVREYEEAVKDEKDEKSLETALQQSPA